MSTLNPYTGDWTFEKASFLLGRTIFGKTSEQINECVENGLEKTIDKLFEPPGEHDPPIYYKFERDPDVPVGNTWLYTHHPENDVSGLKNARGRSTKVWQIGLMSQAGVSITEKMVLFFHEHLPINNINGGEILYNYLDILRRHALGSFRRLIEEITISPAMLIFLNGNQNSAGSPNENFARELLELFTIGRGDAVGEGDYTNYTEQDVVQIARSLTGWRYRINEDNIAEGFFRSNRHDSGEKQLSYRFNDISIYDEQDREYKRVIEIILQKEEVARHLCRKLHIWFIGSNIDDEVELNIIAPLAKILYENNYEIAPVVKILLQSEYFLSSDHAGCMITSPVDYLFKIFNTLEVTLPENLIDKYFLWQSIGEVAGQMEMAILSPPSVAGWKAYYQAPNYYQFWISSVTLGLRDTIAELLINGVVIRDTSIGADVLSLAAGINNSTDPNLLIDGIVSLIFEVPISDNQKEYLKSILLPGLPDFEWTVEYGEYLADPENPDMKNAITSKLQSLVLSMIKMPEFHLM